MKPARSLRVVLVTVGSRGDVQPMLALAQALHGMPGWINRTLWVLHALASQQLPHGPRQAAAQRLRESDGRGQIVRRVEALAG